MLLAVALGASASAAGHAFTRGASAMETMTSYVAQLIMALCPGLALAGGGYALYSRRESGPAEV